MVSAIGRKQTLSNLKFNHSEGAAVEKAALPITISTCCICRFEIEGEALIGNEVRQIGLNVDLNRELWNSKEAKCHLTH